MLDHHKGLGVYSQAQPAVVGDIEQAIIVNNSDRQIVRVLELAGTLDVASGAWLSPINDQGDVAMPIAHVGETSWTDIERATNSANLLPGLFSDRRPPFPAPGLSGHLVCMIGNRRVGRAALFLRQKSWHASVQTRLSDMVERIRGLVHTVWIILKEVASERPSPALSNSEPRLAEALIDQHPFGVVILDLDQQVHLANRAARKVFQDGDVVSMVGGRLVLDNTHDAIRVHVALRSVLTSRSEAEESKMIAITGKGGEPLLLMISKLASSPVAASVVITRPSAMMDSDIQPLAEHFGLTPVEVRVVAQLVRGLSVQEAAGCLQLKVQTARTYLKQIFHKTGVHRQVELMHLMRSGTLPRMA